MTILPHCDLAFCRENATFETPFTKIGVCPEFCSSILFPRVLGPNLATEVLFFGKKLTSKEAEASGLVAAVIPCKDPEEFLEKIYQRLRPALEFPNSGRSMHFFKKLVRNPQAIAELEQVHRVEMALLDQRSAGAGSEAAQGVSAMQAKAKKAKM